MWRSAVQQPNDSGSDHELMDQRRSEPSASLSHHAHGQAKKNRNAIAKMLAACSAHLHSKECGAGGKSTGPGL